MNFQEITTFMEKFHESSTGLIPGVSQGDFISALVGSLGSDQDKVVVGIDIYRYSKFPSAEQKVIPYVIDLLRRDTIDSCIVLEEYFFQKETHQTLDENFIGTGDGGFQILSNPVQAMLFLSYLETTLRCYNSGQWNGAIRQFTGELSFRYCVTRGAINQYNENWYGAAIIRNARLLSKDKLNRCIIDSAVYQWFQFNTNGVETIEKLSITDFFNVTEFSTYDQSKIEGKNVIIDKIENNLYDIKCSKIGDLSSKGDIASAYNLFFKVTLAYQIASPGKIARYVSAIGNLYTNGIEIQ